MDPLHSRGRCPGWPCHPGCSSHCKLSCLRERFALADDTPSLEPQVLLLDHEYTEHGLRWPVLKGADRWRVAAQRAAVESLGPSLQLALAELNQTWTANPLVMPMAEPRRQHVQAAVEADGAPLVATTLKQGSPHKLVLRKPDDLLARNRAVRQRRARDLSTVEAERGHEPGPIASNC